MIKKPAILIDFDGVIHSYEHGWNGGVLYGTVLPGFFLWAHEANRIFNLVIYSSRSSDPYATKLMMDWVRKGLNEWHDKDPRHIRMLSFDDFTFSHQKVPAFITIDDRAITFNGNWNDPAYQAEKLLEFKPWNASPK